VGTAISILVGQRIGERQPKLARKTIQMAFYFTIVYMSCWCVCYLVIPQFMVLPFLMQKNADAEYLVFTQQVSDQVTILLRFVVIYSIFDGMAIIYSNAIRGAGDTRFPVFISTFGSIFLLVIPALLLDHYQLATVLNLWCVITVFIMFSGVALYCRYLTGRWEKMSLIQH
jgi:MATE family multidrug resistance protein